MFDKVKEFENLTSGMLDLYKRKNADYGDSFEKTYLDYGLTAFLVRAQDKINRLYSINKKKKIEVTDESVLDTLRDLANYSIMQIIEMKKDGKTIVGDDQ